MVVSDPDFDPLLKPPPPPSCPRCGTVLSRSQPLTDRPLDLLGACPLCGGWYRLDPDASALTPA